MQIFGPDEALLGDLREELFLSRVAVDENGKVLAWTDELPIRSRPRLKSVD